MPTQWEHCRGIDNPADYLSKGVNADQLKGLDAWWREPTWLSKGVELWPCNASTIEQSPPEERKTPHAVLHIQIPAPLLDPSRYSSYWRLLRVTAWIFRSIRNVRFARRSSGELTASELTQATCTRSRRPRQNFSRRNLTHFRKTLTSPGNRKYLDSRWPYSSWKALTMRRPFKRLTLPTPARRQAPLCSLVDLANAHTPSSLGSLYRSIRTQRRIGFCVHVKPLGRCCTNVFLARWRSPPRLPNRGSASRRPQKPFGVKGIGFEGPLYINVGSNMRKGYIALFTCTTTRAVHLELCTDMTTDKFLLAFQQFVGRRGLPHTVYTENAQAFLATNYGPLYLQPKLTNSSLITKFIGSL